MSVAGNTSQSVTSTTRVFRLEVPRAARRNLAVGWLMLALASLIASGFFSLLLVLARASFVKDALPLVDFFRVALVVHVDLSVLVWFLAFAGVLWSINSTPRALALGWMALWLAVLGTAIMCAAPFVGGGDPIMANYIPVLNDAIFLTGLGVFAAGFATLVMRGMIAVPRVGTRISGQGALRFGLNSSTVSAAVALIAFGWSWLALPPALDDRAYFELLFWGGGHVIQFTYTLLMLVAWLWLADAAVVPHPMSPRVATLLFGIGLAAVFLTPVIYLAWGVTSVEHHRMLTWLMQFGGGVAIVPFGLALLVGLARAPEANPDARALRSALTASLVLFCAGGVIGLMIHGSNVKIPAHYHGCIVGITLALMGLAYHLLPAFGFQRPNARLAHWQAWIYGGGQLLHIAGLVWGGGYGVQRKVAGAAQALRTPQEFAAMGLMGLGGLIAVIGGLMFLVIVVGAIARRCTAAEPSGDA